MDKIQKRKLYLEYLEEINNPKDMKSFDNIKTEKYINENIKTENILVDKLPDLLLPETYKFIFSHNIKGLGTFLENVAKEYKIYGKFDIENFNKHIIKMFNESYGVSSDVLEWTDFVYDLIVSNTILTFISSKKVKEVMEVDDYEGNVETGTITYPTEVLNKIIEKHISEENSLKLRDFNFIVDITACDESVFDADMMSGFFNDEETYIENGIIKNSKLYIDMFVPFEIYNINKSYDSIDNFLKKKGLRKKLYEIISHELDHTNEFIQRKLKDKNVFPERLLNFLVYLMQQHSFSQISPDWLKFLEIVYLHLSFEQNARVTQLFSILKNDNIKNQVEFWEVVKDSDVWNDIEKMKNFDAEDFILNFELSMSEEDIKEVFSEMKTFTEEEIQNEDVTILVLKYLISLWDSYIDQVNKEFEQYGDVKLDKLTQDILDNPMKFFKFFEKRFHKNYEKMYRKISKLSANII